jgi:hypothetical protein
MTHTETLSTAGEAALEAHGATRDQAKRFMRDLKSTPVLRMKAGGHTIFLESWGDPIEALLALYDATVEDLRSADENTPPE